MQPYSTQLSECDIKNEIQCSRFLHFRGLAKKPPSSTGLDSSGILLWSRQQEQSLKDLISSAMLRKAQEDHKENEKYPDINIDSNVMGIVLLHRRGQAIVEMKNSTVAARALMALHEIGYSKSVSLGVDRKESLRAYVYGNRDNKPSSDFNISLTEMPTTRTLTQTQTEEYILTEVERSLAAVIRTVITKDSNERALQRRQRKQQQQKHLNDRPGGIDNTTFGALGYGESSVSSAKGPALPKLSQNEENIYREIFNMLGVLNACMSVDIAECGRLPSTAVQGLSADQRWTLENWLSRLRTPIDKRLRRLICWKSVSCGRWCGDIQVATTSAAVQGTVDGCSLLHARRPVTELPLALRSLAVDDNFTASREASEAKTRVNAFIADCGQRVLRLGGGPRCLVLDAQHCQTSTALTAVTAAVPSDLQRKPSDVIVPNYTWATHHFMHMQFGEGQTEIGRRVCTAHYGSVRSLLDQLYYTHIVGSLPICDSMSPIKCKELLAPSRRCDHSVGFGLVYLDYCCRFSAGYRSVEQSPRGDLAALFGYGLLTTYAEIIVCVREEEQKTLPEEPGPLEYIEGLGRSHGYEITERRIVYRYGGDIAESDALNTQPCAARSSANGAAPMVVYWCSVRACAEH